MAQVRIIETADWKLTLPADWRDAEETSAGEQYFESEDGTKGLYMGSWQVSSDTPSVEAALQSFLETEENANKRMPDSRWVLMEKTVGNDSNSAFADWYDKRKQYRIATKIIVRLPIVVKATLHDYDCADYKKSKRYFEALVRSLSVQPA